MPDPTVLADCRFYCEEHGHTLDNGPHIACRPDTDGAVPEAGSREGLDANPDCQEGHGPHVPINIGAATRDRLRLYLMDAAPRGMGYTAFIDRALDAALGDTQEPRKPLCGHRQPHDPHPFSTVSETYPEECHGWPE